MILPPWIQYPGSNPTWAGWRQGTSEDWFVENWLPFWTAQDAAAREAYLRNWPAPDEEWQHYLTTVWG